MLVVVLIALIVSVAGHGQVIGYIQGERVGGQTGRASEMDRVLARRQGCDHEKKTVRDGLGGRAARQAQKVIGRQRSPIEHRRDELIVLQILHRLAINFTSQSRSGLGKASGRRGQISLAGAVAFGSRGLGIDDGEEERLAVRDTGRAVGLSEKTALHGSNRKGAAQEPHAPGGLVRAEINVPILEHRVTTRRYGIEPLPVPFRPLGVAQTKGMRLWRQNFGFIGSGKAGRRAAGKRQQRTRQQG